LYEDLRFDFGGWEELTDRVDKSAIDYHGRPQREYLFEILGRFCERVFVSCKQETDVVAELNPLADRFDMESPLNGILSALTFQPDVAWLTVPADMPMVDEEVIRHLVAHRNFLSLATCYWDSEHRHPEPLLAIWEPQALPSLREFYEKGNISPREFLNDSSITLLEVPHKNMHVNINTPDELKSFQQTNARGNT
jgi:molybdopterin-guanine dinucleotide biosynthesis protein A